MSFETGTLVRQLEGIEQSLGAPARYLVALSGGLDSTVLLHALATSRARHGRPVAALHVDHGLHPESAQWAMRCRDLAAGLGVDLELEKVAVEQASGSGPEAAAREARYAALSVHVGRRDWLLSAHHRDDQAETLLLNLMRGSGALGLAGIPAFRRLGAGWLVRPLLEVPRAALERYAADHGLDWIEDPGNAERRFDRNFLRHELLPLFESRWPGSSERMATSAALAREAAGLLAELARIDLEASGGSAGRIPIAAIAALPQPRARNLLRHAFARLDLEPPNAVHLSRIFEEVIAAREDAGPVVAWPGAELRRYRGQLYLLPPATEAAGDPGHPVSDTHAALELGRGLGTLDFEPGAPVGLSDAVVDAGLAIRFRGGGEAFRPFGHSRTRKLKKLLQERGIVPWMRDRLPLLYSGEKLVAVADLWLSADAASEPGTAVRWRDHPPID